MNLSSVGLAAVAVLFVGPAMAGTTLCKSSVQDAHGIATGYIATDGTQTVPIKASFVFPSGPVVLKADGFTLETPQNIPEATLYLSAQYGFEVQGNDIRINLEQVEVDGPGYVRPDGKAADPVFVLAGDGNAIVREQPIEADGTLTLMLHPTDGKSTRGDVHVREEERGALATVLDHTAEVVAAAGDTANTDAIYSTVIHMTDVDTRNKMIAVALRQAAALAPNGDGCQASD